MSEHTPLPWTLHKEHDAADGDVYLIIGPSKDPVLKVEPLAKIMYCEEQDARLMVDARELLEALKFLYAACPDPDYDERQYGEALSRALKIINKPERLVV